ncbi:trypsin-like serine protease [Deinococcus grandis]|uniref:Trypsin-like serine protease n=1 Tax=Deinococcus grandis TaxID=57498 RepID=A0A117DNM1_9DEIO|nr:hypothetical protein DEGR_13340 [Deinococcus grandis]GAQ21902.1 trypsin-like serine protease [Deinococcus grandis]
MRPGGQQQGKEQEDGAHLPGRLVRAPRALHPICVRVPSMPSLAWEHRRPRQQEQVSRSQHRHYRRQTRPFSAAQLVQSVRPGRTHAPYPVMQTVS